MRLDSVARKVAAAASSVRTGIVLLITLGLTSASGTLVLQRPLADQDALARAYRPETLAWFDRLGLTDVFHSWWFLALMSALAINIVLASIERWPNAWRYIARPYRKPEAHFIRALPLQAEIPITDSAEGVRAAETAFRRLGLKARRVGNAPEVSLYAERYRFSRLAAYVVHASLLLILAGGIVDGLWGYRGFVALSANGSANEIELRDGTKMALPFTLRCDAAGQENYPDGSPKRWWSKLAVIENGSEVKRKEIEVNEPLVHRGLRFFQASYGDTGEVNAVRFTVAPNAGTAAPQDMTLRLNESKTLDADTTVTFARFLPDFVVVGREVQQRSNELRNPAILLMTRNAKGAESKVWLFPKFTDFSHNNNSGFAFQFRDLESGYYTGLQVAYEPGQWAVWAGCILMAVGLAMAFYFVHVRAWAVPMRDGRGRTVLWVGASTEKNRADLEEKFRRLTAEIRKALAENTDQRRRNPQPAHA